VHTSINILQYLWSSFKKLCSVVKKVAGVFSMSNRKKVYKYTMDFLKFFFLSQSCRRK
jgi:hypothetical protein